MIVTNFLKTFKLLPPDGKLMGQDHLGNKYYEAASSNPHSMRKSKNRWFEPKVEGDWQQNLPAEWEAWLRGRRQYAPTEEIVRVHYFVRGGFVGYRSVPVLLKASLSSSSGRVARFLGGVKQGKGLDAPHLVQLIGLKLLPYLRSKRPFEQ
ncbi:mimitin, mitochondrial [Trichonephila clavipes]|nr:mimitin, mitochondrial [Trichonephila clavipes]